MTHYHISALFISNDLGERWTDNVAIDLDDVDTAYKAAELYRRHNRRAQNGSYRYGNYRRVQIVEVEDTQCDFPANIIRTMFTPDLETP